MLQLSDLAIRLGDRTVVENLSLDLQVGEIGCLLGASGCGKTTVLRAIAGFERPAAGSIVLAGKEVSSAAKMLPPEQRQIGMVFQDYALFPHLTVAGNIAFGLRGAGRAEQATRVADALKLVGLDHVEQRYPHELSGGQQQRVALARALAPRPQLLLMDEPFSNLDVELRERLGQEVRAILKAAGMTAILVTHDQREAFAVADKVGVMTDGHIRQWATPYDLYHQPLDRFVADFVGEGVLLPGIVAAGGKVEFELGIVHGKMPENCCMGCVADVLVRPDDVLHDDASSMKARVLAKAFRGAQFLYTLALPSGQKVLSLVPSHHNHALGEDIGIRLEIDHVIAFKRG
ncbi:ABC transporter ATP-binding protein [Iodobacter fluviatilis]|jgi:iron(III) transport system ATP-binding protein|uniref:ABC transporter ATP-binding protein n=1 Tax=Iodobacter fluviatilis TaxID=537 RepID=A0A7G3GD14_9NEIS|nr:ABC transporter ATP-binding protein [Iodobacter fluviatilis]QBC45201.1 ABC transporter ATP-binding protein [Iodobacter fluviatilis]